MLSFFKKKLFGSANDRFIRSLSVLVDKVNSLEIELEKLSDAELSNKTQEFRDRLQSGIDLDDLLPEAFAVVREAAKRVLSMRHFDVQIIGGIVLHKGMIAEMRTGEGKTLVATLAAYLNALTSKGVHIVTTNDYLAQRDAKWMGQLYNFLGMSVGCITSNIGDEQRKEAYLADITYGTNNELGFDYLRDNLKYNLEEMVQKPSHFAIVDEVDSILIDEARTPLIISGPAEDNSKIYGKINKLIFELPEDAYEIDEKVRNILLTDKGNEFVEKLLKQNNMISSESSLYDLENMLIVHYINQALKAHKIFKRDIDYIIKDNKILIIDEFTGRMMIGRRYSDGLHQALEAKENVPVQNENQTIASVTFQNYFRMYPKLSGMTGTAMTEAAEFNDIYRLPVVTIPTNVPVARIDEDDLIYKTSKAKYSAIVSEIEKAYKSQQPVLVGTVSIEKSELLSSMLKKSGIKHNVLNAKYHAQEAEIIAQAGRPGAVTIATNMAGRGTDIKLGGNTDILLKQSVDSNYSIEQVNSIAMKIDQQVKEDNRVVLEKGGLLVIGTERHESRRIDDQLRGRSGRQGDPGRTIFFLSLEDDLMRLFGSDKLSGLLTKLGLKEDEAIVHPWISKSLQKAQQKVEGQNYEVRKNILQFDDVMNEQRKVIYSQRLYIMGSPQDLIDNLNKIAEKLNKSLVRKFIPKKSYREEWDLDNLEKELFGIYGTHYEIKEYAIKEGITEPELVNKVIELSAELIANKLKLLNNDEKSFSELLQKVFLITLDQLWKDHLHSLDQLRTGINLRAYAQKNPLNEYKIEAFALFKNMIQDFEEIVVQRVAHLHIVTNDAEKHQDNIAKTYGDLNKMQFIHDKPHNYEVEDSKQYANEKQMEHLKQNKKVSRNQSCPCGSGKKYKYCHGIIE